MVSTEGERPSEASHVRRTLSVLELLTFNPLSASEVASVLGAQPRTIRRVLDRLRDDEYVSVRRDGRRQVYEPTMRLAALGSQVVAHSTLAQIGRTFVELAHARTGAVARLVTPAYHDAVTVIHVAASTADSSPRLCELLPAHASAGGKALLAYRPDWLTSLVSQPLSRVTDATIVDPEALRAHVRGILDAGVAVEDGEREPGLQAVAVPVMVRGEAVAALSVSAHGLSLDGGAPVVREAARRLSVELQRAR